MMDRPAILFLALLLPAVALPTAPTAGDKPVPGKGTVRARLKGHNGYIHAVAYSPDGRTLASGDSAGTIRLWDTRTDTQRPALKGRRGNVWCLAFSPDGKTLASSSGNEAVLWDMAAGKDRAVLRRPDLHIVSTMTFSPDGKSLAVGGSGGGGIGADATYSAIVWDPATGKKRVALEEHAGEIHGLAFSPDGQRLAVSSGDGKVRLWEAATGKETAVLEGAGGGPLVFTLDGALLLTTAKDQVTLWEMPSRKLRTTLKYPGTEIRCLALSADGKVLAAAGYGVIANGRYDFPVHLWDLATAKERQTLRDEEVYFHTSVAFAPDGKTLATAGYDMLIRLWALEQ